MKQTALFQTQDTPLFSQTAQRAHAPTYTPKPAPPRQLTINTAAIDDSPIATHAQIIEIDAFEKLPPGDMIQYNAHTIETATRSFIHQHGQPTTIYHHPETGRLYFTL